MILASPRCNNRVALPVVQKRNYDQKKCTLFFFHPNPKASSPIKQTITLPVAGNLFNQPTPPSGYPDKSGRLLGRIGSAPSLGSARFIARARVLSFFVFSFSFFFWRKESLR